MNYSTVFCFSTSWLFFATGLPALADQPDTQRDVLGHPLPAGVVPRLGGGGLVVSGDVAGIAFSPDGSLLAASWGQTNADLQIWNAATGKALQNVRLPHATRQLAFSADGRWLFTSCGVVEAANGRFKETVNSMAVSPDGKLAAWAGKTPNQLVVSRPEDSAELWSVMLGNEKSGPSAAAFSPQGHRLAVSGRNGELLIVDTKTGKALVEVPAATTGRVSRIVFSPDGKRLAVCEGKPTVTLLNVETGKVEQSLPGLPRIAGEVAFSADGRLIAAAGGNESRVVVWNAASGRQEKTISTVIYDVHALALSADGAQLAVGGRGSGGSNLQVFDVADGKERFVPDGPRGTVGQIAFSANSRRLATGSAEGAIHLWDATDARPLLELKADSSNDLSFSLDGWTLSACGREGTLAVWEADTGDTLVSRGRSFRSSYTVARISSHNDFLACGARDGKIDIVKFATGEKLRTIQAYSRTELGSLAVSPDGKLLASSAGAFGARQVGDSVDVWNAETGKLVRKFSTGAAKGDPRFASSNNIISVLFSPAGNYLAARDRQGLHLWEVSSGERVLQREQLDTPYCFAPNGRYFACRRGANLMLIELITGQPCLELALADLERGHPTALAISPDGRLMAMGMSPVNGVPLLSLASAGVDPASRPSKEEISRAWEQLADSDAKAAYGAAWTLASAGNRAVDFLRDRLGPLIEPKVDPKRVAELVAALDDDRFKVRDSATTELERLGPAALPHLKEALKQDLSSELKFRLSRLISGMEGAMRRFAGEPLRRLRAIGVLERVGTRPGGELLAKVAAGPPTARETLDAQAALVRLKTRLSGP